LAVLTVLFLLAAALTFAGITLIGALPTSESDQVPTSLQADSESPTTVVEPTVTEGPPEPPTTEAVVEPSTTEALPAADAVECGVHQGVVCEGFFTDEPKLATDRQRIEDRVAAVASEHDVEFALVVVNNSRGAVPNDFAIELGSAWGVGDPAKRNGLVVLVSIDEQNVEVAQNENVDVSGEVIAAAAGLYFPAEEWDTGLIAIVVAVDQLLGLNGGESTIANGNGAAQINIGQHNLEDVRLNFSASGGDPLPEGHIPARGLIQISTDGWRIDGAVHCVRDLSPFPSTQDVWEVRFVAFQSSYPFLPTEKYASLYVKDDPAGDGVYILDDLNSWDDTTCGPRGRLELFPLLEGDIEIHR